MVNASYTSYTSYVKKTSYQTTVTSSANGMQVQKNDKASNGVELSDTAKSYLEGLKSKYSNVSFTVADFSTDAEASNYMKDKDSDYSCVITPDLLEKMASDETVAKKYEDIIAGAGGQFEEISEKLGDDADKVESYGITVDKDGEVSYYAVLKQGLESLNKAKADADAKNQAAKDAEKTDKTDEKNVPNDKIEALTIKASTIEALLEKIKSVGEKRTEATEEAEKKDGFLPIPPESFEKYRGKSDGFDRKSDDISAKRDDGFRYEHKHGAERSEPTERGHKADKSGAPINISV